jgi:hypothetical protein
MSVKAFSDEEMDRGRVVVAVSLDISNAFNTLPFSCIEEAMRYYGLPAYIRCLVANYLQDRKVTYVNREGQIISRRMCCGVPQGRYWTRSCGILDKTGCYEVLSEQD